MFADLNYNLMSMRTVKGKELWSSPRGINLKREEWETLVENIPAINEAVKDVKVNIILFIFEDF